MACGSNSFEFKLTCVTGHYESYFVDRDFQFRSFCYKTAMLKRPLFYIKINHADYFKRRLIYFFKFFWVLWAICFTDTYVLCSKLKVVANTSVS